MTSSVGSDPIWVHSQEVRNVCILGGTHGNESNGVALARHFIRNPVQASRPSFQTKVLLHNTAAIEKNTRYVEEDLNRCYSAKDLADDSLTTLESKRAKEINALLGPKGSSAPAMDLIIDLHNTTANTGVALMMPPKDELSHAIGKHLMEHDPTVRICNWNAGQSDYPMLPSIARHGFTFEVGPVSWGCIDGALYRQSLRLLELTLDYVHAHNLAVRAGVSSAWRRAVVPVHEAVRKVDYPRHDDGTLSAMLHPEAQGRDFEPLRAGDPLFLGMDGVTVTGFEPSEDEAKSGTVCYPFFLNEAAYYEKGMALMVGHRADQPVRVLAAAAAAAADASASPQEDAAGDGIKRQRGC